MEVQLSLGWENAWICFEAALICFSSFRSSADYLATKHPMDVSSLAGRVMSSLRLSTRIHPITGWPWLLPSSHPIPPSACLTVSLPLGEGMGLPRSAYLTADTLGPLCLPAGMLPVSDVLKASEPPAYHFGPSLTAPLACLHSRQLQVFTYIDHSILS
jgi:hypothetical protein